MSIIKALKWPVVFGCILLVLLLLPGWIWGQQSSDQSLTPDLPADPEPSDRIGNRAAFDQFSWQTFVALNWQPDANGNPDKGKVIGQDKDNPTIWESWMEDYQVLVKTGEKPPAWGSSRGIPAACTSAGAGKNSKLVVHATKTEGVVSLIDQAQAGPLIDQNAAYVRYEITMNESFYTYILDNDLYNQKGIAAHGPIDFPWSTATSPTTGATMVKAAWKLLGSGDDPARFHVTEAFVYNASKDQCSQQKLGLVGLHFGTKTKSSPQWVWSTFEHLDNAPTKGGATDGHFSFFNPNCVPDPTTKPCLVNGLPKTPWDPTIPGQTPVQIMRITPVDAATAATNKLWQSALLAVNPKSVWANYQLIATQYPQVPDDPTETTGRPFPLYLANTAIETYMQGTTPIVSSSCIGCHNRATAGPAGEPSDFTYILSRVTAKH